MSKRDAILSAATRLFSSKGYKQTSMSELSRVTGAAGGTIFHHFKNKEDLFMKVLENCEKEITTAFEHHQQRQKPVTGLETIEDLLSFYLHLAGEMQEQFLLLHRHYPYQITIDNTKCSHCLESIYTCLLDIFEKSISMGIADGSVKNVPARNTAMILFAMVDGIARLNTYRIYHAGSLYSDMLASCRSILQKNIRRKGTT